jgi:hypothetical protein
VTNHTVTDYGKTLTRILRPRANEIHASVLRFAIFAMRTIDAHNAHSTPDGVCYATNGPNPRKSKVQRTHHHPLRMIYTDPPGQNLYCSTGTESAGFDNIRR